MAAINDLIRQVEDKSLRERLQQEVARLSKQKKFGLVFEDHIPECTPLYGIPIRKGSLVAVKGEDIRDVYCVSSISGGTAAIINKISGNKSERPIETLVVVAQFGEPIYPSLISVDSVTNAPDSSLWHMLTISVLMACLSLFLSKPGVETLRSIDWHTLAILFMMLTVLEGFKKENIFQPVLRFSEKITSMVGISFFLIFGVFFSSMFVTNDVSLIVFVPLTILLFRTAKKEPYILPVISMENIAAIRGSLLTPFGSPQNLFLFEQSGISAGKFMLHMLPLWLSSAILLGGFIFFLYRKDPHEKISLLGSSGEAWKPERKKHRIIYVGLFALTVATVVSRTPYWPAAAGIVIAVILLFDRAVLRKTDYVLLVTFFCFFVFSSQITANKTISHFLTNAVAGHEYFWGIGLSQIISNVPASIVLYPFTDNLAALLYGVDTAGLCSVIGSLASVINYRLYVRSYPGQGGRFMKVFTLISWAFFLIVVIPGYFLSKYWLI